MKRGVKVGIAIAVPVLLLLAGYYVLSPNLRYPVRWILESESYKAEVLASQESKDGYFRHTEWDGWGFAGAGDTTVYLVFDPGDSLARAAQADAKGKFTGIPCEVYKVRRFERGWYAVSFYTDTDWEHCS
jgi:hypothetical protein